MTPKSSKSGSKKPVTNDERFSSVHSDPRFKMPKRNDFKVKVDDRFKESDLKSLNRRAKIDKYGRKLNGDDEAKAFKKYYKTNDQDEEDSDEAGEEEEDDEDEVIQKELDRARGEGVVSDVESSSDESSSEEEDSDMESDIEAEEVKPEAGDPERRFAVVNLDWDHVNSTDLMATFQSFVPAGGLIESVAVYPSEFGKERLQKEEIEGPPKDVFKSKKSKKPKHGDDDDESDSDSEIEAKDLYEEDEGKEDYDSKSLRRYQLQRLRYYYAVVTCDSVKTAKSIYDNCDGTEYESTANFFDLRFIPDEMEFDEEPRDSTNKIPSNYKPESFVTDALQHSKVKLTWDETPAERVKLSSKSFSQRELDDMDFKAYLASDNSDDEEEIVDEELKNKYRNLVGSSTKIGKRNIFDSKGGDREEEDDDDDVDMEITFTPGLDSKTDGENAETSKDSEEESTLDKLKRKAKERRKARKDKIKELEQVAKEETKSKSKKKDKKDKDIDKKKDAKSKAELELLMLDEDKESKTQHFNMKELVRSEKEKSKKAKHRNREKIIEDDFKADLNDPRFKEIFTNHDFAIDPSQPQFKNTSTMKKILEERNKLRDSKDKSEKPRMEEGKKSVKRKHEDESNGDDSFNVKSLVQKLKRKANK